MKIALQSSPFNRVDLFESAGFEVVEGVCRSEEQMIDLLRDADGAQVSVKPLTSRKVMEACPKLKVVPATIHIPLKEVSCSLSVAGLSETIKITNEAMKEKFNISEPVIAVSGLNPHAGENGQLGREEKEILIPAIRNLQGSVNIIGPLSADAMFHPAARAKYDVAITMYHDQALIPLKTIGFEEGVNITLGLSFVRTSPDHGTAFDLAGQNIADETSTINAIKMAVSLSRKCKDG